MQETQETWVRSLGGENPLGEEMETHSSILARTFHGQRSLVGYSPRGHKESDMAEHIHTHTHTHTYSCCRPSGFRGCGAWALLPPSMCDLPRPEIEPTSPALQDEFLTTGSPREVQRSCSFWGVNSPMKNAPKFNVNDRLSLDYGIVIISQFNSV